jgi:uncharacterized protein
VDPLPDRPPAPPAIAGRKSALAFFGVLLALWFPGAVAQAASLSLGLAWSEVFVFLLSALVATTGSNLRPGPCLRPVRGAVLGAGALCGAAGYLFAGSVVTVMHRLLPARLVETFDPVRLFEGPRSHRIALAVVATMIAPACEEIAFRGYMQTTLGLRRRPAVAIAGAAVLFGLLHLNPVLFPALVVLGALFGWLAWRAGSIWPAVVAHAVNNGITSALVLSGPPSPPEAPPAWTIFASVALGAAALLALVSLYRALTPDPPPLADAVVLRDPGLASIRFSPARVPKALATMAAAGAALLAVLLAAGTAGGRVRWR